MHKRDVLKVEGMSMVGRLKGTGKILLVNSGQIVE
jgi:hypothetical protein